MAWLRPPDGRHVVYEFFSPFAHLEGRYEWCRIRSPTHGAFDVFIFLEQEPVVVYVSSTDGARFMRNRYPECETHRVPPNALRIAEGGQGRVVRGTLRAAVGPVRRASMVFTAPERARPRQVPYGGKGLPVWGSRRFTCWGVDLVVEAAVQGFVQPSSGPREVFEGARGLLTLGSFGRIAALPTPRGSVGRV